MKLVNWPEAKTIEFYEQQKEEMVELARSYRDIVAVYTAGSVSQPGISDLDFILCLSDDLQGSLDIEEKLSRELRNVICGGTILKIDKSNFTDLKIIDDFPLQHLNGQKFSFKEYNSKWFEICRVLDWLPERLHSLLKLQGGEVINVRCGLGLLKSITVSLSKLQQLTSTDQYHDFVRTVTGLRAQWFKNERRQFDFLNVLKLASKVAQRAIGDVSEHLQQQGYIKPVQLPGEVKFTIPRGPEFIFAQESIESDLDGRIQVPTILYPFFAAQAYSTQDFLGSSLRKCFSWLAPPSIIESAIDPFLWQTIKKRMEYCERVASFLSGAGITRGLLKYGWFL